MISEGPDEAYREAAAAVGEEFNADYAFLEEDDHGTHTLVLKYGDLPSDITVEDFIEQMKE